MKAVGVIIVSLVTLFILVGGLFILCVLPQDKAKPDRRVL